ncbi:hypothetical protein CK203_068159 [Vitis vinifera]|uniref:Uncharacterized protein n=1 Tax=Vitis vinifera TaxID=29760 RepID=A0A438E1J0_VITVI|nr:hypothetical protein CK203_068159 [Vitis vinifera]
MVDFSLVIVYFALGSCMSAYGCWVYSMKPPSENGVTEDLEESRSSTAVIFRAKEIRGTIKLQSHYDQEAIQRRAGLLGYLMQIAYQLMGCMHTMNAFFLLLDTSLNSLPFPWFRLSYFVLWSCIYVIFQWVIHACGFSWWPYPFLELSTQWAPLW